MRVLAALLIATLMYVTPVWLFDQMVLPQLQGLQDTYGKAENWVAASQAATSAGNADQKTTSPQVRP